MSSSVSHRRASLALLALSLLFPLILLAPAAVTPARAAESSFTFDGGGWGHAVGLSQYGAYGMALLEGADAETILTHYYTGVSLRTLGDDIPDVGPVWVNLIDGASSALLRPAAISGDGVTVTIVHEGSTFEARPGDAIRVEVVGSTNGDPICRLTIADAVSEGECFADLTWDGELSEPTTRITIEESAAGPDEPSAPCTNPDWNAIPTMFRPCSYDDGTMHIRPSGTDALHVVLQVDVDPYVEGISEMPYFWGNPTDGPNGTAALEAQAIASRSYAISRQIARGNPADTNCWCDVVDTAADQRYVGWGHTGLGYEAWSAATETTAGVVLTHPAIGNGAQPITAYYGSSSYGTTESGLDGFAQDIPYLQSVDDRWANDPAVTNVYSPWSFTRTGDDIAERLGLEGRTIVDAEVSACSDAGAAMQVRFVDDAGDEHLRASRDLRSLLGIRSPQITAINGVAACGDGGGEPTSEPSLTAAGVRIDDDDRGDSVGNGDATAQCGETVELFTTISNGGAGTGALTVTIGLDDANVAVVHNTTSPLPAVQTGEEAANSNDWDLAIAESVPDGSRIEITLEITDANGPVATVTVPLVVECEGEPAASILTASGHTVDDGVRGDSVGNNDGAARCRETIELYVELTNTSDAVRDDVTVTIESLDDRVRLLYNASSPYPPIAAGGSAENSNDWDFSVGGSFGEPYTVAFRLVVSSDGTEELLTIEVPVECPSLPGAATPGDLQIDDGPTGDSIGNNDGRAQCGETIEVRLPFEHMSGPAVPDLTVRLRPVDPALSLLHNTDAAYPAIDPGESAVGTDDWDITIGPVPNGYEARVRITYEMEGWRGAQTMTIPIECNDPGPVSVASVTVDDGTLGDSIGNNNKVAQCGELIELYVGLQNLTATDLDAFEATLSTEDPALTLLYNQSASYSVGVGATGENLDDWDLQVGGGFEDRQTAVVTLTIDALDVSFDVPITLRCAR